ncbi:hypothetical protein P7K49_031451 [Saguinus oedipus]|uniref:Uncharacterized protein n=1 Tax=Saguinus oedipus TaxID=9490 RepID=A0ABQ9U090_SAGOE|nr:hypothetical protein P7K49_031451 [Saguinus oedipus]
MEHPILRLPVARDTSVWGPPVWSQSRITSRLQPPEEPRVSIPASFMKSERPHCRLFYNSCETATLNKDS